MIDGEEKQDDLFAASQGDRTPNRLFIAVAALVALSALVVFTLAVYVFGWGWTGFNGGYDKITITSVAHGTTISTEQPQTRTLWDWLSLLIVPIMLAVGGFWLNNLQKERDLEAEKARKQREERAIERRAQTEREIAEDNQRETALQAYIDKMSDLLLDNKLRESKEEDEVRDIARIEILTVLRKLDAERKGSIIQFLEEARLINAEKPIVVLSRADLSGANLSGAYLRRVNFSGANLSGANLSGAFLGGANLRIANLSGANLSEANLSGADLNRANLNRADLSGADLSGTTVTQDQLEKAKSLKDATMPDGSKHS